MMFISKGMIPVLLGTLLLISCNGKTSSKAKIEMEKLRLINQPYFQLALIWVKDTRKFEEYVTNVSPIVKKYGGQLDKSFLPTSIYAEGVEQPHIVNLVHYSSKAAFEKMKKDKEFKLLTRLRDESTDITSYEGYLSLNNPSFKNDGGRVYNIELASFKNEDPDLYRRYEIEGETVMSKYGYNVEFIMDIDKTYASKEDFAKVSFWNNEADRKKFEDHEMHDKIENELYPPSVENLIWITAKTHPGILQE